jgi:hypothetical protein
MVNLINNLNNLNNLTLIYLTHLGRLNLTADMFLFLSKYELSLAATGGLRNPNKLSLTRITQTYIVTPGAR